MKPYTKNYAPKSRQEVAGGNDHCWIAEVQKPTTEEYRQGYVRVFGEKPLNLWPRDENGELIDG